jgi:hypothetical protein
MTRQLLIDMVIGLYFYKSTKAPPSRTRPVKDGRKWICKCIYHGFPNFVAGAPRGALLVVWGGGEIVRVLGTRMFWKEYERKVKYIF